MAMIVDPNAVAEHVFSQFFAAHWTAFAAIFFGLFFVLWLSRKLEWQVRLALRNLYVFGRLRRPKRWVFIREQRHARMHDSAQRSLGRVHALRPRENPARFFAFIRSVGPYVFEEMVLLELQRRGLRVERNRTYSKDGGVDGRFALDGIPYLVQAKRYKGPINPDHVYHFQIACEREFAEGVFIHTGVTPISVLSKLRQANRVTIVSGEALVQFFAGSPLNLQIGGRAYSRESSSRR